MEIQELKDSYYEYIPKIAPGIQMMIASLKSNNLEEAFISLANLAEGLSTLLKIEESLSKQGLTINSNIATSIEVYEEMNAAIENEDFILLADILQYELLPLFSSSTEWTFSSDGDE